jgi:hypothetical protein
MFFSKIEDSKPKRHNFRAIGEGIKVKLLYNVMWEHNPAQIHHFWLKIIKK